MDVSVGVLDVKPIVDEFEIYVYVPVVVSVVVSVTICAVELLVVSV